MDRLGLYNRALRELRERKLASLSEDREPRRLLDDVWNDGGVDFLLGTAQWRFATRTVELLSDPDIEVGFGYQHAFAKPDDHIRTTGLFSDESLHNGLTQYRYEGGYFYSDMDTLWLRYVSNDADYGGNLSLWPSNFGSYAALYFATQIMGPLTGTKGDPAVIERKLRKAQLEASATDAMEDPMTFSRPGSWVTARGGSYRGDRGSRSRLIG